MLILDGILYYGALAAVGVASAAILLGQYLRGDLLEHDGLARDGTEPRPVDMLARAPAPMRTARLAPSQGAGGLVRKVS